MLASRMTIGDDELCRKVVKTGFIEFSDSASLYMINVADYLPEGEQKPLDLAESEIKELLVNSRKAEFLQQVKREIYNKAIVSGEVKFYDKQEAE